MSKPSPTSARAALGRLIRMYRNDQVGGPGTWPHNQVYAANLETLRDIDDMAERARLDLIDIAKAVPGEGDHGDEWPTVVRLIRARLKQAESVAAACARSLQQAEAEDDATRQKLADALAQLDDMRRDARARDSLAAQVAELRREREGIIEANGRIAEAAQAHEADAARLRALRAALSDVLALDV